MKYAAFALAAVAAAGAASAQTKWVPLNSQQAKQAQGQALPPRSAPAAAPIQPIVAPTSAMPVAAPLTTNAYLRVGTEIPLRLSQELTTKGKQLHVGDRFHMEVADSVLVQGVVVIPAGSPAMGEITDVRNKGMWGKSGHLAARILYVTVNGRQIRLSGAFDDKGVAGGVGAVAVSALIAWPAGFFMTGTSARLPIGTIVKGYVDEDVPLAMPAAAQAPLQVAAPAAPMAVQPTTGQQH
jgi:hypothetical protein